MRRIRRIRLNALSLAAGRTLAIAGSTRSMTALFGSHPNRERLNRRHGQRPVYFAGTRCRSLIHASALPSDGARQSPRGESEPPEPTLGALGIALRLYWLVWKKRRRNTPSHLRIWPSVYLSRHAFHAR